ncbi:hypothetical protein HK101_006960 [Irineochytrium annulatum]|nr:hypothetical protein HK101_006960 [Irineochytrium annulatum]
MDDFSEEEEDLNERGGGPNRSSASPSPAANASAAAGSSSKSAKPRRSLGKRANHNELERKRRSNQRDSLNRLKDVIPGLRTDKPSAIHIIERGRDYIGKYIVDGRFYSVLSLEQRIRDLEAQLEALRKSTTSTSPQIPVQQPHSQPPRQPGSLPNSGQLSAPSTSTTLVLSSLPSSSNSSPTTRSPAGPPLVQPAPSPPDATVSLTVTPSVNTYNVAGARMPSSSQLVDAGVTSGISQQQQQQGSMQLTPAPQYLDQQASGNDLEARIKALQERMAAGNDAATAGGVIVDSMSMMAASKDTDTAPWVTYTYEEQGGSRKRKSSK